MRFFLSARAAAYNFSRPKPDRQHACFEPLHPGVYIGNRRPDRVHPESQFRILITAESNWLVATTDTPGIFQRVAAVRLRPTYCAQYAVSGKTRTFLPRGNFAVSFRNALFGGVFGRNQEKLCRHGSTFVET
jgi:hypothetical protein